MIENRGLFGLSNVNIELTSRCNKSCWMCGRRRIERDFPELALSYSDIDFSLLSSISKQLPENIVVQLHNNGEPLLYENFGKAVNLFRKQITSIDTNGKLLIEKFSEIVDNLDTLAISIIEDDDEAFEQLEIIKEFLKRKKERKPFILLRLNGNVNVNNYKELGLSMSSRIIHHSLGSFNYKRYAPTIPEIGICLDFLHHMAINTKGEVSICVRFDPKRVGVIGDAKEDSLSTIWNSEKRLKWLEYHKTGRRERVPLCSYCHFWGVSSSNPQMQEILQHNQEKRF